MIPGEFVISVLIVEASCPVGDLLKTIINDHPRLTVTECVTNGEAALASLAQRKPDIVLMDISMPGMDGFATTRRIMETVPLPIVICSQASAPSEVSNTFLALEAGALAFVEKPMGPDHTGFSDRVSKLIETLITMSEVKVVKRWPQKSQLNRSARIRPLTESSSPVDQCQVIGIGASTGGPPVLQTILQKLPQTAPPVLVVQHISAGFLAGLTGWLEATTGIPCHIAAQGETLVPGAVYFAPDGCHMGLSPKHEIYLSHAPPEQGLRPSVNHLFRSIAQNCADTAIGILLTGMGKDGAEELKNIRELGGLTIAQLPESCIVNGMPGEAIRIQGACKVMSPEEIALYLATRFGK